MSRRGIAFAALLVAIVACGGLSISGHALRAGSLRNLGEVTAVVDDDRPGTVTVHSRLGGRTATWLVGDDGAVLGWGDGSAATPRARQCVDKTCYRVATTALRVEVSDDGGSAYATSWEITGDTYATLARSYPDVGNPAEHLSSRSLVVHAVAGGHVVFVANGRDGLLYRGVDGAWLRQGFPSSGEGCCFYEPALPVDADPRPVVLTVVAVVAGVLATLLPAAIIAARRPRRRWVDLGGVIVLAAVAGYGSALAVRFPDVGMFPGLLYGIPVLLGILVGAAALSVLFAGATPRQHPGA